jgi:tight adherence protein B
VTALEILVGELRIGAHPVQAFTVAAAESTGPVGDALRAVAARARLGGDVAAGLRSAAAESAVPTYWLRLAVFWELAVQQGLPMAVLIRAAHRDIVDRQRFSARIGAALAGARATAVILAGLPVLGVLLGQLIGAAPLAFLFGRGVGGTFLVVGIGLIGAGLWWADRIIGRLVA